MERIDDHSQETVPTPHWVAPSPEREYGEIERTVREMFPNRTAEELAEEIEKAIKNGAIISLDDVTWSRLENTDSNRFEAGDTETAMMYSKEAGRKPERVMSDYLSDKPVDTPIILKIPGERYYLVSGNTRLTMAKGMNIRPKVLICDLS